MRSTLPLFILAFTISAPAFGTEPVQVPSFRSVQVRGGGDVMIVPGPVQRVTVLHGSTRFTTFRVRRDRQLQIDACNGQCPRNYNLRIRIESPRVPDVAITGGGTIIASAGFAPQPHIAAAVTAGGTIDLRAIEAHDVSAAVNAGGDIYVRPRATLTAAVKAGGDIHYAGHPQVFTAISDGGNVSRED